MGDEETIGFGNIDMADLMAVYDSCSEAASGPERMYFLNWDYVRRAHYGGSWRRASRAWGIRAAARSFESLGFEWRHPHRRNHNCTNPRTFTMVESGE